MNHTEIAELMSFDMGLNIKASHLKTVGNWLFLYRKDLFDEDGTKEVECYTLPCGPDTFEAHTDIPYDASPFAATKEVRAKAFDTLNEDYVAYLRDSGEHDKAEKFLTGKYPFGYGLLAVSGDCGGGMGEKHDLIVLNGDHFEAVKDFLRYQLEWSILCAVRDQEAMNEFYKRKGNSRLHQKLIKVGVFGHKWHIRSDWVLIEMEDGKPINDLGFKINIIKQGEHVQ